MKNAKYAEDFLPLDEECSCKVCRQFSRAYIRHLLKADEVLGIRLTTYHNLHFLLQLMQDIRLAIEEDRFLASKQAFYEKYFADAKH